MKPSHYVPLQSPKGKDKLRLDEDLKEEIAEKKHTLLSFKTNVFCNDSGL